MQFREIHVPGETHNCNCTLQPAALSFDTRCCANCPCIGNCQCEGNDSRRADPLAVIHGAVLGGSIVHLMWRPVANTYTELMSFELHSFGAGMYACTDHDLHELAFIQEGKLTTASLTRRPTSWCYDQLLLDHQVLTSPGGQRVAGLEPRHMTTNEHKRTYKSMLTTLARRAGAHRTLQGVAQSGPISCMTPSVATSTSQPSMVLFIAGSFTDLCNCSRNRKLLAH